MNNSNSEYQKLIKVIVLAGNDILLLTEEANGETYQTLPGGKSVTGESLQHTLLRQLAEELGLPDELEFMDYELIDHRILSNKFDTYTYLLRLNHKPAIRVDRKPNPDEKIIDAKWLNINLVMYEKIQLNLIDGYIPSVLRIAVNRL